MPEKPYISNSQRVLDMLMRVISSTTMPETADAIVKKGAKRFIADPQDIPNDHPQGVREGSVESLIKAVGARAGSLINADQPYLEQYLHPDVNVLPNTLDRPKYLRPYPNVAYKSPAPDPDPESPYNNVQGLGRSQEDSPDWPVKHFSQKSKVHDLWDFDTTAKLSNNEYMNTIIKTILQNSGKPYAVYGGLLKDNKK